MTDRQMEDLILELYLALDLPEPPVFTPTGRMGWLKSQTYTQTKGFMAKFVEDYDISIYESKIDPECLTADMFDACVGVNINYRHGEWESQGGTNGVGTYLYFHHDNQQWISDRPARDLIAIAYGEKGA